MTLDEVFHEVGHLALVRDVIAADETRDAARFASLFTADGSFAIGGNPPLVGRDAIAAGVAGFFATLGGGIAHRFLAAWGGPDALVWQAEVTWTLGDGRQVSAPYVNVLRLRGGAIADYRVHVDLGVLAPPAPAAPAGVLLSPDSTALPVLIVIDVAPARQAELLAQIRTLVERTVAHQPGFRSCSLHVSSDGSRIINYALWADQAAYDRFMAAPRETTPALFTEFPPDARSYRLAYQAFGLKP